MSMTVRKDFDTMKRQRIGEPSAEWAAVLYVHGLGEQNKTVGRA
ncbi:hypothetical protein [Fulvimarina sp. MAC3]